MQALRYASRRALRPSVVMQEPCIASARACSSEAAGRVSARLNKEERYQLVKQFVENFKAANYGQLPPVSLLRKEVGGKYEILKEVLGELNKCPSEQAATQEAPEHAESKKSSVLLKETDAKCHEKVKGKSTAVARDVGKKKSAKEKESRQESAATMQGQLDSEETTKVSAESVKTGRKTKSLSEKEVSSLKDKKSSPEAIKSLENVKSVTQADAKLSSNKTEKQNQLSVLTKDTLEPLLDTLLTDEEDDSDSDVAAPEYHSPKSQTRAGLAQANECMLKVGSVIHPEGDDRAIKIQQQPKVQGERVKIEDARGPLKSVGEHSMANNAAKQPFPDSSSWFGSKPTGQPPVTTVLRVVNLPVHVGAHQLKSICESVARVYGVSMRRGRIADVQFNVDPNEMQGVLERLRKVSIGSTLMKVFPSQRFSCERSTNSNFKPRDAHQFRYVRNSLIHALEQRFKILCFQVQDFRELHDLKASK